MNNLTASYKNSFIEAVILANKELHTYINKNLSLNDYEYTNTTGFGGDNSLKMDLIAENIFIKYLENFGNIYSEECGLLNTNKEFTIVIDPLDGSNNFYSSLPYYGTSVALQKRIIKYTVHIEKHRFLIFQNLANRYFTHLHMILLLY